MAETSINDSITTTGTNSSSGELNDVTFHIVGDAYIDLFSFLDGDWPDPGGDSRMEQPVKCYAGGSSVNTATHLKALIKKFSTATESIKKQLPEVILHTVLNPNDQYGKMLMDHADEHDIPIHNCAACQQQQEKTQKKNSCSSTSTGHCIAIVSGGERSFMTHQGVVENFEAGDVNVEKIANTPTDLHLHIAGFYNIPGFWEGKLKQTLQHIRKIRKEKFPNKKISISLVTQHDATNKWDGGLMELYPLLDFVLMNDLEARSIINCRSDESHKRMIEFDNEHNNMNHQWADSKHEHIQWADYFGRHSHSTTNTIITRGVKGSVALRGKKILSKQKPVVKKNPVDPTGAGDSFVAGFLFGLWSWKGVQCSNNNNDDDNDNDDENQQWTIEGIEEGMRWGVSVASAAVMIRGASIPPPDNEIQKFLNQAKEPEYPVFDNGYSQLSSCY